MLGVVVTSEEVNYLVYRYLLEAGFVHSAFTFGQESFIGSHGDIRPGDVPPGHLVSMLQRGLQYLTLETHINEDGSEKPCTQGFSLLQEHRCSEPVDVTGAVDTNGSVSSISAAADAPLQTSINSVNLALQNASIMASNAVYGGSESMATSKAAAVAAVVENANGPATKKKKKEQVTGVAVTTALAAMTSASGSSTEKVGGEKKKLDADTVELKGHESEVIGCVWNPTQSILATASVDSTVRLWTFPSQAPLDTINPRTIIRTCKTLVHVLIKNPDQSSDVTCLEWRPDGAMLATGCYDGKARLWTATGDLVKTLQKHMGPLFALKWSRGAGKYLLSGGMDEQAIVWDGESGTIRHQLHHHTGACLDVDWRSSATFVTCGSDKRILFYDLALATEDTSANAADPHSSPSRANTPLQVLQPAAVLTGHEDEVNCVLWNREGKLLASGSDDKTGRIWRVHEEADGVWRGECVAVLTGHEKEIYTIDWHPHQNILATASFDQTARLWTVGEGVGSPLVLQGHSEPVYAVAFSVCGRFVATGSLDGTIVIWRVGDGEAVKTFSCNRGGVFSISWRPVRANEDLDEEPLRLAASYVGGVVLAFDFYPNAAVDEGVTGAVTGAVESGQLAMDVDVPAVEPEAGLGD